MKILECQSIEHVVSTYIVCERLSAVRVKICTVRCSPGFFSLHGESAHEYRCGLDTGYAWVPNLPLPHCDGMFRSLNLVKL